MKADAWLQSSTAILEEAGVGTARLDALVMLENVLGRDRAYILAHPEIKLLPAQIAKLKKLLSRRAGHEPLAYILGRTEFYGRSFIITPEVLEPRPESEAMIDELKNLINLPVQPCIADVGTGSGALGITAKLELPDSRVDLIDIDPKALKTAKMNVDKLTAGLNLIASDLLATTTTKYVVLLCNLPYVPDAFQINTAASHEPRQAIFGGTDGLDVYRRLFGQLKERLIVPLYILSESLPTQHADLETIAREAGYAEVQENDFIQVFARIQK